MQPCPRKSEATLSSQLKHDSRWRDDGTCSYCGSLSPELFFKAIEEGVEIGPMDKDYKVYVHRPDPDAGKPWINESANFKPDCGEGWFFITPENVDALPGTDFRDLLGRWVRIGKRSATLFGKFYFQHLDDGRARFVELLNAKRINIGPPGHFYQLPFFVRKEPRV